MAKRKPKLTGSSPRWKCYNCGSTDVEVQYGVWYTETKDYTLTEIGGEMSGVEYHYCNGCEESFSGTPDENE